MADRYWVGGSGTWNTTSTTNWSASSGGPSGASVPTVSDSVFFDQNSTYTVTMTGALACLDFNVTGGTVTFQNGTSPTLNVRGSWSTIAGTIWNTTGAITFSATTSTTITSNNITIRSPITFNGLGGTWTLQDNLSLLTTLTTTLTTGTLSLGTNTLSTGLFASSGTGVRTINFGTGKIQLTSATTSTIWNTGTITSLTISGTPLVECIGIGTGVTKTITTGALTEANSISFSLLTPSGTSTYALGSSRFRDLLVNGVQTISNAGITLFGNFTHLTTNGTTTFTAGTSAWTFAATSGTYNLGYLVGFTYDFPWILGGTVASTATFNLTGNLTLGATRSLNLGSGTTDFNDYTFSGASLVILQGNPSISNTISGNVSISLPITHTAGNLTLSANLTTTSTSGYTFNSANLILNDYILSTPTFSASGAGSRTLNFSNTGQLALTGQNTTIFNVSSSGFNTSGNIYINATYAGNTGTRTFVTSFSETQSRQGTGYNVSFSGNQGVVFSSSATDTLALSGGFNSIDFTGFNGTFTNASRTLYGDLVLPSSTGTFSSGTVETVFGSTAITQNITSNGRTLDFPIAFSGNSIKQLVDKLTVGNTRTVTVNNSDLRLNDQILETGLFVVSGTSTIGTRIVNFGDSGEIRLTGNNGTILNLNNSVTSYLGKVFINSVYTGSTGTRTFNSVLTEAQATSASGFNVYTSGSQGIIIGTTASDQISLTGNYNDIDLTGLTNTILNTARTLYGSLIVPATGGTLVAGGTVTTLAGSNITTSITTNGRTLDFPLRINAANGTVELLDNLTLGSTRALDHNNGTFNLNGYTAIAGSYTNTGTTTKILDFTNGGKFEIPSNNQTVLNISTASNLFTVLGTAIFDLTYTGSVGTRTIVYQNSSETQARSAGLNVSTTGPSGIIINGAATDAIILNGNYVDVDFTGFSGSLSIGTGSTLFTVFGNLTIPANFIILGSSTASSLTFASTQNNQTVITNGVTIPLNTTISLGSTNTLQLLDSINFGIRSVTLTSGILDLNDFSLTANDLSSSNANIRTINFKDSGIIYLTGSGTTIINFATMTNLTFAGTPAIYCTYTLGTGTRTINIGATAGSTLDNIFDLSIGNSGSSLVLAASTDVLALTGFYKNFDLTGLTGTLAAVVRTIYGNLTIPDSGGSIVGTNTVTTLAGGNTQYITTNGRTFDVAITVGNGTSNGNVILNDALTIGTRPFVLTSGTFDLNNFTTSAGTLSSTNTNIRSFAFGDNGQFTLLSGNTTVANFATMTNFFSTGNACLRSTYTLSTGTRTFNFGGTSVGNLLNAPDVNVTGNTGIILGNTALDSVALIGVYKDVDLTGLTNTITNTVRAIYGNFIVPNTGGTLSAGTNTTTLAPFNNPVNYGYSVSMVGGTGGGDSFKIDSNPILQLGTQDFEISFWVNLSNVIGTILLYDQRFVTDSVGPSIWLSDSILRYYTGGSDRIVGITLTTNVWYYITVSRVSNVTRMFVNDQQVGNDYTDNNNYIEAPVTIGTRFDLLRNMNGFISNLKVNKGSGVTQVTVPDAPATVDEYTVLLACQNSDLVWKDNSIYDFPASITGFPSISFNTPFLPSLFTVASLTTNGRTLDFPIAVGDGTTNGITQLSGALTLGSTRTLTLNSGTFDLNDYTATSLAFSSTGAANRVLSFANTGQLTLVGSNTTIINMTTANNFAYAGTPKITSSYNAGTGTRTFALGNAAGFSNSNSMFDFNIAGSNGIIIAGSTDSLAIVGQVRDLDLRNTTNTITNTVKLIYGNFYTSASGGTFTAGTAITTFASTSGISTIDTEARALAFPIRFDGAGGNWTLANNLVANATSVLTLANGIVDFNQKELTYSNITVATGNSGLSNLSTTLNFVHSGANANLTVYSGAINVATTGTYVVSGIGSSVILEGPLSTGAFTLTVGNLILANANLTCPTFTSNGSGVRSVQFSSQDIIVTSTGTVVNMPTATNFTSTGTGNVVVTHDGNTAITITPGGPLEGNALNFNFIAGNYNLTITAGNVNSLDFTGYSGNLLNTATRLFGNLTLSNTMTLASGTAVMTFANNSEQYILTNGQTLDFPVTVAKTGNRLVLADTTNIGNTRTVTLTSGNLDVANPLNCGPFTHSNGALLVNAPANTLAYTLNGGNLILNNNDLTVTTFTSNNSTVRSIDFNGNINVTATTGTIVNMTTATNQTVTGNGNINITNNSNSAVTVTPGNALPANTINYNILSGNYTMTMTAGNVKSLNFTGYEGALAATALRIHGDTVFSSNMNVTASTTAMTFSSIDTRSLTTNGKLIDRPVTVDTVNSTIPSPDGFSNLFDGNGDSLTIPDNSVLRMETENFTIEAWVYLSSTTRDQYIISKGTSGSNGYVLWSPSGGTLRFTYGASTNITTTTTISSNVWTHVAIVREGTGTDQFKLYINGVESATSTVTYNFNDTNIQRIGDGRTGSGVSPFLGFISNLRIVKGTAVYTANFTPPTSPLTAIANTSLLTCQSSSFIDNSVNNFTITPVGDVSIQTFSPFGVSVFGTLVLNDALTMGSSRLFTLGNGTINLNNLTLSTGTFATAAGNKSILFDGGTLLILGTSFNNSNPTDFTTQQGNNVGTISMTSGSAKTFAGGNATYYAKLDQSGAGNLTITGNNFFNDIIMSYTAANNFILLPAGGTTSVENLTGLGSSNTNFLGLYSATVGNSTVINYAGEGTISSNGFLLVRDVDFTPFITDGTSPISWYLGANANNQGNVTGALFVDAGENAPIVYAIESGANWTVPNNWNSSNNKVHLYGAGGGGAGCRFDSDANTRAAGSGGGGGGYTVVANFQASLGSTISYQIGLGGNGGTANSNGENGGNTIWSNVTYTAGGGGGGTTASTPSSTPGLGGLGATYNGGNGGSGSIVPPGGPSVGGGGGGGAGGPFGIGGNGGEGFTTNLATSAGGGGGGSGGGTNGANANSTAAGSGGNSYLGIGSGAQSSGGTFGGGGGGGRAGNVGGTGGTGVEILNSIGGGGGGGGTANIDAPNNQRTMLYGGGGGGGGSITSTGILRNGGNGANGVIIIEYYIGETPVGNAYSGMFLVF
jgi:hypothetical protein